MKLRQTAHPHTARFLVRFKPRRAQNLRQFARGQPPPDVVEDRGVDVELSHVQFERLLGEVTVPLEPAFLRVPREGVESRFLPVKDREELARRASEIEAIARARGMLG